MSATTLQREAQALTALAQANEIRLANAELKRRLRAMSPAEAMEAAAAILDAPDEFAGRLELRVLLRAIPRFGDSRTARLMGDLGMPGTVVTRRIADHSCGRPPLTPSQRERISARLRKWSANGGWRTPPWEGDE